MENIESKLIPNSLCKTNLSQIKDLEDISHSSKYIEKMKYFP